MLAFSSSSDNETKNIQKKNFLSMLINDYLVKYKET